MNRYALAKLVCVIISTLSQILLKKSANKKYDSIIKEYLNAPVIISYAIFFISVLMDAYSLNGISLAYNSLIDSLGYILIPIFSYLFLQEKLNQWQLIGILIVFCGFVVFSL